MFELFARPGPRSMAVVHCVFIALDPPRTLLLISDRVQTPVTCDAEQPGTPRRSSLEAIEISERFQEDLLPHFLGKCAVAEHANAKPEHGCAVGTHQVHHRSTAIAGDSVRCCTAMNSGNTRRSS